MKSSDEMIQDLYERREQYQKDKKMKQAKRMKVMLPVACACIIVFIGAGAWKSGLITDRKDPAKESEIKNDKPGAESQFPNTTPTDNPKDPIPTGEMKEKPGKDIIYLDPDATVSDAYSEWRGKTVSSSLLAVLDSCADDDVIAIQYGCDCKWYQYNGAAIANLEEEYWCSRQIPSLMYQMLKYDGEYLAYGSAIYETGAPDGTKWAKEFYESQVVKYKKLIDAYIVDGVFLRDKLQEELDSGRPEETYVRIPYERWQEAVNAFYGELASRLRAGGVAVELYDTYKDGWKQLVLFMTKEEFAAFAMDETLGQTAGAYSLALRPDSYDDAIWLEPGTAVSE